MTRVTFAVVDDADHPDTPCGSRLPVANYVQRLANMRSEQRFIRRCGGLKAEYDGPINFAVGLHGAGAWLKPRDALGRIARSLRRHQDAALVRQVIHPLSCGEREFDPKRGAPFRVGAHGYAV